eukprot:CAMPEP_0178667456 /NCGR_PEP_ID=MMETSP0698-20121128/31052_1 /TAXON_ID=265572 /ORGANISM="Extubocellulus spinifer, Strain CCMP396" /LENGTH=1467 /DNA_ID=CAMNT_0020310949 /DNA_START=158 /DNA_END=4562 /DNA_ORIENTATION=-
MAAAAAESDQGRDAEEPNTADAEEMVVDSPEIEMASASPAAAAAAAPNESSASAAAAAAASYPHGGTTTAQTPVATTTATASTAAMLLSTATQMMRLTSPNDYALATRIHAILADGAGDNDDDAAAVAAATGTGKDSGSTSTTGVELLAPGAALLTCLVLAVGREELVVDGNKDVETMDEETRKRRAREAAGYTLIDPPSPRADADGVTADDDTTSSQAQAQAAASTGGSSSGGSTIISPVPVPPPPQQQQGTTVGDTTKPAVELTSPPVGTLHTFATMPQHLSDLASYCRTRSDVVTVSDVVAYLLDFVMKEEQEQEQEEQEAMSRIRRAMLDHPSLATAAAAAAAEAEVAAAAATKGGTTSTTTASPNNRKANNNKTLQLSLQCLSILRRASATIVRDAECSADFTYLWDSCAKVLRRTFAQAFMGCAGYETRYEAMAEAARCAYVMSRYYGITAASSATATTGTAGSVTEETRNDHGGGDGTPPTAAATVTVSEKRTEEQNGGGLRRVEDIVTGAACIALVYRTAVLEPDIRRVDAENARMAAKSGEKGGTATSGGGTPVKNKETQKAIPSPTRPGATDGTRQKKRRSKKNKKRKADGDSATASAGADEEDGSKEDMDKAKDEDMASSSSSSNEKSAAAAVSATAPIAPYPRAEVASYYYGPLRIPRTSRSNETEALDSLSALAEKEGDDSDNEYGSSKTLPDIVRTLVMASNEVIALLQSSNAIRTTSRSAIPTNCSKNSAFLVTETMIEHEMEQVYKALAVDKKHFNAFHSTMPGSGDMSTVGTPAFARKTVPLALAPFLGSHWARFDSGRIMASLYFYRLLQSKERKTNTSSSSVPNKIEAFIANPNLIEYSSNQGSFVQSSYTRYHVLGAISPIIKSGLDVFGISACVKTPVAKVCILDVSAMEPFHDGPYLFDNDEAMVDSMEENEWINSLLLDISRARAIKPSSRLRLYLRSGGRSEQGGEDQWKDVIVLILNSVLGRISNHYFNLSLTPTVDGGSTATSPELKLDANGELVLAGLMLDIAGPMTDNTFGAALLALYYFSLEAVLYDETSRTKTSQHHKLILSPGFHRSLLAISCMCLLRVVGAQPSGSETTDRRVSIVATGKVDVLSVLELTKCSPFDYLKVSEIFLRSSRQGVFGGLPVTIRRHVTEIDELIIERSLWATKVPNSNWKVLLQETDKLEAACHWPTESLMPTIDGERKNMKSVEDPSFQMKSAPAPPASSPLSSQYKYIDYIFRRVSLVASKRISALCKELSFPTIVATEIWLAFRYILRSVKGLLKDRHMDQVLLATAYAVCRLAGLDPHSDLFSRLCTAYEHINEDKGKRACQKVIQSVVNEKMAVGRGNIIDFYNKIYMYEMKTYLIRCASLKLLTRRVQALSGAAGTTNVAEKEVQERERARQVDGTNVYLKLPDSKRPRHATSSLNAKGARTKCIHSFGDASQKNVNLARKLLVQGAKAAGD